MKATQLITFLTRATKDGGDPDVKFVRQVSAERKTEVSVTKVLLRRKSEELMTNNPSATAIGQDEIILEG